jgi:nicotinamidase-related amidase
MMLPTTLCDANRSMLIVIDLQQRLMPAIDGADAVLANALLLQRAAGLLDVPVLGTAQNPAGLGPNLPDVEALCGRVIAKDSFDACAEPAFLSALDATRDELVVLGCEAHVCVLQTVLGLRARGHRVRLVADAIGSRRPTNRDAALQRAQAAGAEPVTTEMVLFEWLRDCRHPQFKACLSLIRERR